MGKIKFFDNQVIANFIGESLEIAARGLDTLDLFEHDGLLSVIPFGRLVSFLGKKLIIIKDVDTAFQRAFSLAYFTTLSNALKRYNIEIECEEDRLNRLKKETANDFKADAFDVNHFQSNESVTFYRKIYENFLIDCDIMEPHITKIFHYLRDYLALNFFDILEKFPTTFKKYTDFLKSKPYEISLELNRKNRYYQDLKNEFTEPMFNDESGMSLFDTYVEPGFRVHEYCVDDTHKKDEWTKPPDGKNFMEPKKYNGSIHQLVWTLLKKNNPIDDLKCANANVIFILGYPGQGKSSFCKKILFDIITGDIDIDTPFYFLRFKDIKNVLDFINSPLEVIKEEIAEELRSSLDRNEFKRSLLILDGLDELCMRYNMNVNQIDDVCKEIIRVAEQKIIITSRYGYIDIEKLKKREALILQLKEFDLSHQIQWLRNYRQFYPLAALKEELLREYNSTTCKFNHLKELINQPILLYMLAASNFMIENTANRAIIYDNLFTGLIERKYDKSGQVEILKNIGKEDLREFIRDISLSIFHTGKDYIHKSVLLKNDSTKQFIEKMDEKSVHDSLKGIMIAFYFREVRKRDEDSRKDERSDYAIEFLHKSLYEYMVAEKIWNEIKAFLDFNPRTRKYHIDDYSSALEHIFNLFSRQSLSQEIENYLVDIIKNDQETDKEKLSERMSKFLPQMLEKDFLYEYDHKVDYYPITLSLNTFYGYWIVLSHLLEGKNYITNDIVNRFVAVIKALPIIDKFIFNLDLSYQYLRGADFSYSSLLAVKFFGADLREANLDYAILCEATLSGANLSKASIYGANLREVNFSGANLTGVDFGGTDLDGAQFNKAILQNAILSDLVLFHLNFSDADLRGTDLKGANLRHANLSGAVLRGAELEGTDLQNADLSYADLRGAYIDETTNLISVNFYRTDNIPEQLLKGTLDESARDALEYLVRREE